MAIPNNPLSSISYTNKDFRAIYEELLDLVKKLTYKWDPSISNESDPGVILLKLNAIIGDKNNYNIDKNILEAFPETVTQEVCARSMYKQLAYNMPWYQSATTTVSFKWVGRDLQLGESVVIPQYTMLTDSETSVVYTLLEQVVFDMENTTSTGNVMQGIITDLTINGSTEITLNNIDSNNRLYLNDYSVAENGIFITNIEDTQSGYWEPVDNLQVVPSGNRYYEFGVDTRSNSVYLEFPDDIETLIKSGLNVKYLLSDGQLGNVASKVITNFYDDVTVQVGEESINLNEESVQLYNPSATTDGSDPEPVERAYKSYRRVAGTFDTLVTLRDYINAIYNSELVSNCVVSDRLNDIQTTYSIVSDSAGAANSVIETLDNPDEDKPYMTSYDLKMYLLHTPGVVDSIDTYEVTFDMDASTSDVQQAVENYILEQRCIQHDFVDILPNIPCLFRNVYPLRIKLVPQYRLTEVQIDDVKRNIMAQLFETLNSREVDFGAEPDYNLIYDTIINADERIKLVVLDDLVYTTFATYWDGSVFKSIPISIFENYPYIITKNGSDFSTELEKLNNPTRYYFIDTTNNSNIVYTYSRSSKTISQYSALINDFRKQLITKSVLAGVTPLYNQETTFDYSIDQQFEYTSKDVDRITTDLKIAPFGFDPSKQDVTQKEVQPGNNLAEYTLKDNESLQFLAPSFVTEVNYSNYVKFELVLNSSTGNEYQGADYSKYDPEHNTYDGKANPVFYALNDDMKQMPIQLTDPVSTSQGEMQYQRAWELGLVGLYIYVAVYRVDPDTDYKLRQGDYITFFYKEVDETDAPYVYRCYKGIANETDTERSPIIRPSFTLNGSSITDAIINPASLASSGNIPYNNAEQSSYQKIYSMYGDNDLSGSKTIDIRRMNQTVLQATNNYYYLITNDIYTEDDVQYYRMVFNKNDDSYDYVLKTDEYFIYTNRQLTEFEVLGPGTLVRLLSNPNTDDETVIFTVVAVNYEDIALDGLPAFEASCKLLPVNTIVREQQIYNLTAGDSVAIELDEDYSDPYYPVFTTDTDTVVKDFKVRYSSEGNSLTDLPGVDIDDAESSWTGTAILNINASYNDPQMIDNGSLPTDTLANRKSIQQITINGLTYPSDDDIQNASLLYLLSNATLTKVGGDNVDVTYLDAYGERMNLEILVYSLNPIFSNEPFFTVGSDLGLHYTGEDVTVPDIVLEDKSYGYEYLLGITNNSATGTFSISNQLGPLDCLNSTETEYPIGSYYFKINSDTTSLIFKTSANIEGDFLTIQHLVKYSPNELFVDNYGITQEDIEEQILVYDKDGLFKYNYQVDPATKIDDPLVAKSFFEENHICNAYTIGNAQLRMSNINSLDSSISVINNR